MKINGGILAAVPAVTFAGVVLAQQYPIMARVADKVIQKYQTHRCEQLTRERIP